MTLYYMDAFLSAACRVVTETEGKVLHVFGNELVFKLTGQETEGKLALWTSITPPGGGPPAHYHLKEDELFLVQEGRMSFFAKGHWQEVGPGGMVYAPRGTTHTFRNIGDKPARMLTLTQPAGIETFFERCAEEFKRPGGPNPDRIADISADHGLYYVELPAEQFQAA